MCLFFIFSVSLMRSSAGAENLQSLTLERALELAQALNPELQAMALDTRSGKVMETQAGRIPNPEFEIETGDIALSDEEKGFDVAETAFVISQDLELGGKRERRRGVAAMETGLADWALKSRSLDIIMETKKAFAEILFAQEAIRLAEGALETSDYFRTAVQGRVEAGKVSPLESARADVTWNLSIMEVETAKQNLDVSRMQLNRLLGGNDVTFDRVVGTLEILDILPSLEQLRSLTDRNPDLAVWDTVKSLRQMTLDLERAARIPDITVYAGMRHAHETGVNAGMIGLALPLPLFNLNRDAVLSAKYQLEKTAFESQAAALDIVTGLTEQYAGLSVLHSKSNILKHNVLPAAQAALDAAETGYRQGKFEYLDVLDAQRTWFEVNMEYLETLKEYASVRADVERLVAQDLSLIIPGTENNAKEMHHE